MQSISLSLQWWRNKMKKARESFNKMNQRREKEKKSTTRFLQIFERNSKFESMFLNFDSSFNHEFVCKIFALFWSKCEINFSHLRMCTILSFKIIRRIYEILRVLWWKKIFSMIYLRKLATIDHCLLFDVDRQNSNEQSIIDFFKRYCKWSLRMLVNRFRYFFRQRFQKMLCWLQMMF